MDPLLGEEDDAESRFETSTIEFGADFADKITSGLSDVVEPPSFSELDFGDKSDDEGASMPPPDAVREEHEVELDLSRVRPLALRDALGDEGEEAGELSALGVQAYDGAALEQGYLQQLREAAARHTQSKTHTKRSSGKRGGGEVGAVAVFSASTREAVTEQESLLQRGLITPFGSRLSDVELHERTESALAVDETHSAAKRATRRAPALTEGEQEEDIDVEAEEEEEQDGEDRVDLPPLWIDDAQDADLSARLRAWQRLSHDVNAAQLGDWTQQPQVRYADASEMAREAYASFPGGYRVPQRLFAQLFDHQKTGVRWLWELHQQEAGGIIADEMGLGKTLTTVAFLGGLQYSALLQGSVLVVCPATVLAQWVREFHTWWPPLRVSLLHATGTWRGSPEGLIARTTRAGEAHVLVTTYEAVRTHHTALTRASWHYVVLDEGHRLRNPDAAITLLCKQFATPHRLLLTGAPIQNNLTELWSLFDFVFPGKLGTLPTFETQFGQPISRGGYAHASPMEVQTAYQCALVLRDLVTPYLLRRQKKDVHLTLPEKNEHVLFCALTEPQRDAYVRFLRSSDCARILAGKHNALYGIGVLRKICNHPALLEHAPPPSPVTTEFVNASAKLRVLRELLPQWAQHGHRALVFTQTVQMLDILDAFLAWLRPRLEYRRMDGSTPVAQRQRLIDEFNADARIAVFLLTTRTGGVGVNLTGADRVVIIDPDWNPSTDQQARERAYRIGQQRRVRVYRLITSGGIEEKIYHRQLYKNFLTLKVLQDPKQTKTLFHAKTLADLFRLDAKSTAADAPETQQLYAAHVQPPATQPRRGTKRRRADPEDEEEEAEYKDTLSAEDSLDEDDADKEKGNQGAPKRRRMVVQEDEQALLKELMGSTLASMLDHDKLEQFEGHAPHPRFTYTVRRDAQMLAQRAVANLRQSREERAQLPLNAPTWTGRHGLEATSRPRFGGTSRSAVSSSVSAAGGATSAGIERGEARSLSSQSLAARLNPQRAQQEQHGQLAQRLLHFFAERGWHATSSEVVARFKQQLPSSELLVFKKLLQEIANFDSTRATWTVKSALRHV